MEGLEIGKIVAEFMMTAVVLYLCNQQIVTLKEQVKERDDQIERLESKLDKCHEEHRKDLRDWSGIEPRYSTWSKNAESDTKLRLTMQEREILAERARNSGDIGGTW
jgi:predicted RNase H-like nuclease (RuvC/YqgF family)